MQSNRKRPQKKREPGTKPERLAKLRNPELFRRPRKMRELEVLIKNKSVDAQARYEASTNVVRVLSLIHI